MAAAAADGCQHIMANGPRKGQPCGKDTSVFMGHVISYCHTHKDKYKELYESAIIESEAQKQQENFEKKKLFDSQQADRKLNYITVYQLARNYESLIGLVEPEGENKDVIRTVDKILINAIISARRFLGTVLSRFNIFKDEFCEISEDDIINELAKRGYVCYPDKDYIVVDCVYPPWR